MSQKILRTMQDDLKEIKNIKMGKGLFKKTVPKKEEAKEEPAKQPSPAPTNASAAPKTKTPAPQVPATPAKENFSDIKNDLEKKGFNVSIAPLSKGKTPIVSEKKKEDASKDFFAKLQEKIAKKKQELQKEEPVRPAEVRKELPKAIPVMPAAPKPVEKPKVDPKELERQQVKNEILTEIRSEVQKEKDKLRDDILAQIKQQEELRKTEILKAQEELKKQEALRADEAKKAQEAIKAQEEKVSHMLKEVTDSLSKEEAEMEESKKAMVEEMRNKIIEEEGRSREQILSEIGKQEELRKAEIAKAQEELKKQEELRAQEIRMSQEALKAEDAKRAQEAQTLNEAIRKQEAEINELVKQLSHAPSKEDLIEAMRAKILEEEKRNREDILRQMKIQEAELSGFIKEISSNLQERSAREEEFQESVLDKIQEGDKRTEGTILARIQDEEEKTKDAILSTIQEEDRKTKDTILARIQAGDQETKDAIMAEVKAQEGDREEEVSALRAEIQDKDAQISNLLKGIADSLEEESDRSEAKEKLIGEMRAKIAELEKEKEDKEDQIKKIRNIMGVKTEETEEKPDLEREVKEMEEEKAQQEEERLKLKIEEARQQEEERLRQEEEARREAEEKARLETEEKLRQEEIERTAREAEERRAAEEERIRQEEEERQRIAEEEVRQAEEEKKRQQEEEERKIQEAIQKAAEEEKLRQEEEKQKAARQAAEEALGMTEEIPQPEKDSAISEEEIKPDEEPPVQDAKDDETIEPDQPQDDEAEETPQEERKATDEDFWSALRKKRTGPEKKVSREAQTNSPEDENAAQEKEAGDPQDEDMKNLIQKISRSMDAPVKNAATAPEASVKPDKDKELKDLLSRMSKNMKKEETQEKNAEDSDVSDAQSEDPAKQNPTRILNPEDDPRNFRPSPAAMAKAGTTYWEKLHNTMKESAISPAQRIMGGTSIAVSPYDNPETQAVNDNATPPDNSELVMPSEVRTAQQRIQERRQTVYPSYVNPENRLIDGKQEFYSTVHKTIKPKMQIESLEGLDTILKDEEISLSEEEEKRRLKQNIVSKYKIKLFSFPWARVIVIGLLFLSIVGGTLMVVLPKFKTQKQELAPVTVGNSITDIDRKITAEAFAKQSQVSSMNFFDANLDPWKSFNNGTIIRLNIDYDNQDLMLSREEALKTVLGENNTENMPKDFLNAISSEYNILVFKGNGSIRLGLVFQYNSSKQDEFKDIMTDWENTSTKSKKMYSVMKNLFVNSRIIEEEGAAFQPAMYNGTELRFQNLPDSDTSMDYFLYEGYVVFASSKDHTFQMIDLLRS